MENPEYKVTWKTVRGDWPVLVAFVLNIALSAWALPRLPEQVPVHWNIRGEADRYGSAVSHAVEIPLMVALVYVATLMAPMIDPRRRNYALFPGAMRLIRLLTPLLLLSIHAVTTLSALGFVTRVGLWVTVGVGLLLVLMGNVMGKVRHNYFVGIKTPWALASEENWQRTHRMAAPLWVAAGLAIIVGAFLPGTWGGVVLLAAVGVAVVVPFGYSYWMFARGRNQ
jgi:uncharacterized membrane protein